MKNRNITNISLSLLPMMMALSMIAGCAKGPLRDIHQSRYVGGIGAKFSKKNIGLAYLSSGPNRLYWGLLDGTVMCVDAQSHKKKWSATLDSSVSTPMAIGPNRLYVGTTEGRIWALDRETGKTIWNKSYGRSARGPMALWQDALAFVSLDGKLTVLQAETGELLLQESFFQSQSFTAAFAMRSAPHSDYWVLALPSGEILALDASYSVIWKQSFPTTQSKNNFWSTVASLDVHPDGTWVTPVMKPPFLLDAQGQVLSTLDSVVSQTPPAKLNNQQWLWAHQDGIFKVDMNTRQLLQTYAYSQPSPLLSIQAKEDTWYTLTADGSLDVYNPDKEQTLWTYRTQSPAKGQLHALSEAYWFLNQRGQLFEIMP